MSVRTRPAETGPRHAAPTRRERVRARGRHARRGLVRPLWQELIALFVVALVLAVLVQTFLVRQFWIPSGSMEDTLLVGDRVLVNRLVYRLREPTRGDVVVFDGTGSFLTAPPPGETEGFPASLVGGVQEFLGLAPTERDFVKRVIGVGGDRVVCCDDVGRVTVNGVALDESGYLYPGDVPSLTPFDVIVPEDKLWVMGDHRSASADSRAHLGDPGGGFVPVDRVIGRAFAVVWPFSALQVLEVPATFDQPALQAAGTGR